MKKYLLTIISFVLLNSTLNAQITANETENIYRFYQANHNLLKLRTVTYPMFPKKDTVKRIVDLDLYLKSMDKIIAELSKNELFYSRKAEILNFKKGWDESVKDAIFKQRKTQNNYSEEDLKKLSSLTYRPYRYVDELLTTTEKENQKIFNLYNTQAIKVLLSASLDTQVDTFTYKGFKQTGINPIILDVYSEPIYWGNHYRKEKRTLKSLLPNVKVVKNEDSYAFIGGNNTNTIILQRNKALSKQVEI